MGQTLPNGIYLPAEGERNCYDGLEGNWRSLDSLISTVAGKASATHTHGNISSDGKVGTTANLPLITGTGGAVQAGSFGNQANTFCEGNDSRLSDARTPVAHTHTKSEITDFPTNVSAFTNDSGYANDSDVVHKSGNESIGGKKTFTDSVLCKGPYFLWTNANVVKGTVPQTTIQPYRMYFGDAQNYASSLFNIDSTVGNDGTQTFTFRAAENVVNGDDARFALVYNPNRTQPRYLSIKGGIEPNATNTYDLGSSSYQWNNLYAKRVNAQSVNGVNPGALGLPGEYTSSVTEYITDKTGGNNVYTAPADGWVGIQASSATFASENFIFMGRTSDGTNYYAQNALSPINAYWSNLYHGCILLPVISGKTYGIRCKCDNVDARFYKANGNVS